MLSAGLSVFSKLIRNSLGLAKKVGVIGTGGHRQLYSSSTLLLFSSTTLFLCHSFLSRIDICSSTAIADLRCLQGHYAVLFANALSAQAIAFISSNQKADDIKKLGVYTSWLWVTRESWRRISRSSWTLSSARGMRRIFTC
jgi:hypothetical protein